MLFIFNEKVHIGFREIIFGFNLGGSPPPPFLYLGAIVTSIGSDLGQYFAMVHNIYV